MKYRRDLLSIISIVFLIIISGTGILSIDFFKSYEVNNQFGEVIKMYGAGIYSHDSFFKAPIFIGTDLCILLVLVPLFIYSLLKNKKEHSNKSKLQLLSLYTVAFYYAASISFGVTYNQYHLLYIALFACTLFGLFSLVREIDSEAFHYKITKGVGAFLILAGTALIVAWLPDILTSILSNKPLALIQVYTTEITYILDMGIIGPLCLVCLYLLRKGDKLGIVILACLLKACIIVGIMMISQTMLQILSGYEILLPVLLTKSGSFVLLGGFALHFNIKLYKNL
ncbi:MAG: hypothetical protein K0S04_4066 [Herbinix sp.]|jgi:hypothetical protein|nr:hypothetical protein [Herbinix sp.]